MRKSIGRVAYHSGPIHTDRGTLTLYREKVADIVFTTGEVMLMDALCGTNTRLIRKIAPGTYPFVLVLTLLPGETEPRPVAAMVEFAPTKAVRWEQARRTERGDWLHPTISDSQVPIDSWHLGIWDAEAQKPWEDRTTNVPADRSMLMEEHQAHAGLWNVHRFSETAANVVTCSSGMGSGAYPAYWGFASGPEPVCLAIDFEIVT